MDNSITVWMLVKTSNPSVMEQEHRDFFPAIFAIISVLNYGRHSSAYVCFLFSLSQTNYNLKQGCKNPKSITLTLTLELKMPAASVKRSF